MKIWQILDSGKEKEMSPKHLIMPESKEVAKIPSSTPSPHIDKDKSKAHRNQVRDCLMVKTGRIGAKTQNRIGIKPKLHDKRPRKYADTHQ